ncbi:hypothetical protein H9P43_002427 [Blastocladiella emersonii ATCC 22665]|nr:hypothetical protein H9P43_002427 [Blastocladiella emersonii ATCC 22665]
MEGKGTVCMYAASKALDLLDLGTVYEETNVLNRFKSPTEIVDYSSPAADGGAGPVHLVLLGVCDPSTVIKTISRARRHGNRPLHITISEPQATLLARHMLLLYIALDPSLDELSYTERTELFLEFYGSLYIRERSQQWLVGATDHLIRAVTDGKGLLGNLIDFDKLRYRERDDLEFVFKFWRGAKPMPLDQMWDFRLKRFYGARYDSRENAVDWDYHMRLKNNTKYITKHEFLEWRQTGHAFTVRDSARVQPNRTLAAVDALFDPAEGVKAAKWGYFGDVSTGPWPAWCTDTEFKDPLLKTANDLPTHAGSDIALHNVVAAIREWHTGRPDDGPVVGAETPRVKITFLSCEPARAMGKIAPGSVDVAVFGSALAHRAADLVPRMRDAKEAAICVETARWHLDLSPAQRGAYCEKVVEMVTGKGTAGAMALSRRQARKLWEASGKWEAVGGAWDYLVFSPRRAEGEESDGDKVAEAAS